MKLGSVVRRSALALALSAILGPAALAEDAADHSAHQAGAHAHHEMTAEELATLRRKIPLYRQYTDEQINASMGRMTDLEVPVSEGTTGKVGILALGHGYKEPGNTFFRQAYERVADDYPTAAGLGMAMMSSDHIQTAVDRLEAAGAETIVVLPTEIGDESTLIQQWAYILDKEDESAYLDVPRVKSDARFVMVDTPTTSPILGDILVDFAREAVREPAQEVALLVAHGPQDKASNEKLLAVLKGHADRIQEATGLAEVKHDSLQDDAPTEVRAANVQRMRDWIERHTKQGHRVIVLQMIMTGQGGVTERLRRDFQGLDYDLVDKGLLQHPRFEQWIRQQVSAASRD